MSLTTLNGAARRTCAVLGLSLCCGALAIAVETGKPASKPAAAPAASQPAASATAVPQAASQPAVPQASLAEKTKPRVAPAKTPQRAANAGKARGAAAAAVAAPVAAPVPAVRAAQDAWDISPSDLTLNAALARWAAAAGWQLLWELPVDYAVQVRTTVSGSFEDAVGTVITSLDSAEMPMKAVFYKGNKVLRIMGRGVQ
ncbi:TcpQ domain-containing protein [Massilia sp. NR 4-1]|uniref:TcpQ domain-containing protein n=1 Tax=Massilia sp. NR 4-1 TaxID=1678028 RepID=UPI000B217E5A|nr:TcpQ domain-containing protein [Massilia sp. NR 4-1]